MEEQYLEHHGVEGQKWGVRRYQNPDGTLKGPKAREHMESFSKDDVYKTNQSYKINNKYNKKIDTYNAKQNKIENKLGTNLSDKKREKLESRRKTYEAEKEYLMDLKKAELKKLKNMDVNEYKRSSRIETGKKATGYILAAAGGAAAGGLAGYKIGNKKGIVSGYHAGYNKGWNDQWARGLAIDLGFDLLDAFL